MRLFSYLATLIASALLSHPAAASEATDTMAAFYKVADSRPFDPAALAKFLDDEIVDHDPMPGPGTADEKEAMLNLYAALASGAPDSKHAIEFIEPVGEDKALVRWRYGGTHTGDLLGFAPTGKTFAIDGMELWQVRDGKIVGLWHIEELASLFQQLSPRP